MMIFICSIPSNGGDPHPHGWLFGPATGGKRHSSGRLLDVQPVGVCLDFFLLRAIQYFLFNFACGKSMLHTLAEYSSTSNSKTNGKSRQHYSILIMLVAVPCDKRVHKRSERERERERLLNAFITNLGLLGALFSGMTPLFADAAK